VSASAANHIILTQIGPDQEFFFELFEWELAPAMSAMTMSLSLFTW